MAPEPRPTIPTWGWASTPTRKCLTFLLWAVLLAAGIYLSHYTSSTAARWGVRMGGILVAGLVVSAIITPRPKYEPRVRPLHQPGARFFSVIFGVLGLVSLAVWLLTGSTGVLAAAIGSVGFAVFSWIWRGEVHS